ncbi:hypothetical protein CONLIGDRAFT_631641 [Coniochaeta ligniaria NRRL 30616]|uniref:Uncharacterized protein n=1 Tax=Coniochaeta ligniaria NRRL 30616 TaxID=1408157 RepID=A0A1J7IQC2_9PEZI|nr:hypothetical protein CONLIGDRAFT_631641 [Coniochaeta ligniaria NRRL 30616]
MDSSHAWPPRFLFPRLLLEQKLLLRALILSPDDHDDIPPQLTAAGTVSSLELRVLMHPVLDRTRQHGIPIEGHAASPLYRRITVDSSFLCLAE